MNRGILLAELLALKDCGAHRRDGRMLEVLVYKGSPHWIEVGASWIPRGATTGCSACAEIIVKFFEEKGFNTS